MAGLAIQLGAENPHGLDTGEGLHPRRGVLRALPRHASERHLGGRPAAPITARSSTAVNPLNPAGRIDLSSVPQTIYAGTPIPRQRSRIYEALLEQGVLPSIPVDPRETATSYLKRSIYSLNRANVDVPFTVEIGPLSAAGEHTYTASELIEDDIPIFENDPVIAVVHGHTGTAVFNARRFSEACARLDPRLAPTLINNLCGASGYSLFIFGPRQAIEQGELQWFHGMPEDWWLEKSDEAADELKIAPEAITPLQVRRWIRQNNIITPGIFRRQIGALYAPKEGRPYKPMTADDCRNAAKDGSKEIQRQVSWLIEITEHLGNCADTIEGILLPKDRDAWRSIDEGPMPAPVIVIDPTERRVVRELAGDIENNAMQGNGFSPSCTLVLNSVRKDIARFKTLLSALDSTYDVVFALTEIFQGDAREEDDEE